MHITVRRGRHTQECKKYIFCQNIQKKLFLNKISLFSGNQFNIDIYHFDATGKIYIYILFYFTYSIIILNAQVKFDMIRREG